MFLFEVLCARNYLVNPFDADGAASRDGLDPNSINNPNLHNAQISEIQFAVVVRLYFNTRTSERVEFY